jgi:hypothetical protein
MGFGKHAQCAERREGAFRDNQEILNECFIVMRKQGCQRVLQINTTICWPRSVGTLAGGSR